MTISRINNYQSNTVILGSHFVTEFDNIIPEVNAKPDADGTLQSNLAAEFLSDGAVNYPVDAAGGTGNIPVCNGNTQVNLNADQVDSQDATDISGAAFDTDTGIVFFQANPPGGWRRLPNPAASYDFALVMRNGWGGTTTDDDWEFSGINVTVAGHNLSIPEMPSHSHASLITANFTLNASGPTASNVITVTPDGSTNIDWYATNTGNSGGGAAHTHAGSTAIGDGTWRPPRHYVIICLKNA